MSVLGHIAHRLKTDIGENVRAAVDVNYSRQLTESRFNMQAQDAAFKREQAQRAEIRAQQLEDKKLQQRFALQIKVGDTLFQRASESGDWKGFLEYIDNPKVEPDVRDYVKGLARASGTKSLDAIRFEHKVAVDYSNLSAAEKRAQLDREKYETSTQIQMAGLQLKNEQLRLEKMQDLRATNEQRNNRRDMIRFIETTPDIPTEAERQGYLNRLNSAEGTTKAVTEVWDEIMDRMSKRLAEREKNHRAKMQAEATLGGELPTPPAPSEIELATNYLKSRIPEKFSALSDSEKDNQQRAMSVALAFEMKKLARDKRLTQTQVLEQAYDLVEEGLDFQEDGGWFWFDSALFSTSEAADSRKKPTRRLNADGTFTDL